MSNDKPGRYDEPIGNQILGVSLGGVTYVTRLHEWTIEYRPGIGFPPLRIYP